MNAVNPQNPQNTQNREPRPNMREADPREAARKRAAEIRGGGLDFNDGIDEFIAPAPPDGWSYEWKRKMVMNQEDHMNINHSLRTGWTPVPVSRHPEMMQAGATGSIERKGMILMERPLEITNEMRQFEFNKARAAVQQKAAQLSSNDGLLGRADSKVAPKVSKGYEPMPIPDK